MSQSNAVFSAPGWTPASESDCEVWFSAQGTAYTNGQAVTSLTDMSGKGLTITGFGTGGGPTFTTNVVNGFPAILFNGTNHYMTVGSLVTKLNNCWGVAGKAVSGVGLLIEQSANINSNNGFLLYGSSGYSLDTKRNGVLSQSDNTGAPTNWWLTTSNPSKKMMFNYDSTQGSTGSSQTSFNGSTRFNSRDNAGAAAQYGIDRSIVSVDRQTAFGTPTAQTVTDTLYVMSRGGASLFQNGYLFEFVSFSSAKNKNFFMQWENFIWEKWGI